MVSAEKVWVKGKATCKEGEYVFRGLIKEVGPNEAQPGLSAAWTNKESVVEIPLSAYHECLEDPRVNVILLDGPPKGLESHDSAPKKAARLHVRTLVL